MKVSVECILMKSSYWSFLFLRIYSDRWHISGDDGEHYFVSYPCENSFPATWCTTSLVPSCSCLSGKGASWMLHRKSEAHSLAPLSFRFDSSGFFLLGVCKRHCHEKVQNVNESWDRIIIAAESITSKTYVSTWWETECHLMHFAPIMVPILRCTEHIRNFVRCNI